MQASYEIRVQGVVPERDRSEFEGMRVEVGAGVSVLTGRLADQAALHGVLARLDTLGLKLVEVRHLPTSGARSR